MKNCDHGFAFTDCLICYDAPGECGYGACTSKATHAVSYDRETRRFCRKHATAPEFGFVRSGSISTDPLT